MIDNNSLGSRLSVGGEKFSKGRSLNRETAQFAQFINKVLAGEKPEPRVDLEPTFHDNPVVAEAYEVDRVLAFCAQQFDAFQIERTHQMKSVQAGAEHSPYPNVVPWSKLAGVKRTSEVPETMEWDTVTLEPGDHIQLHPAARPSLPPQ